MPISSSFITSALRPAVLGLAVALSLAVLPDLAAQPCESLEALAERHETNLGSGWTLPIVANPGHLPSEVAYTALGATNTAFRFHSDGDIEVLFAQGSPISMHPIGDPAGLIPSEPSAASQRWITDQGSFELPGFDALKVDLGSGLTVQHRASSRLLRSTYEGDWSLIGWHVDELLAAGEAAGDGSLELQLEGRTLRLYAGRYGEGDEGGRIPFVLGDEGVLSLDPTALAEVSMEGSLEVVLEVASFFHGYDAVVGPWRGSLAVASTVGATAHDGRDILFVHLDADGAPRTMTVLASSGDDVGIAITRSSHGDVYLAGRLGAAGLALTDKGSELNAGPFVSRSSLDGLPLASRSLAQDGVVALHDLAMDDENRLVLSGRAAKASLPSGSTPLPVVLNLPQGEESSSQAVLVVQELDTELQPTGRQSRLEYTDTGIRLEVRPSCIGAVSIGPKPVVVAQGGCTSNLMTDTYDVYNNNLPTSGDFSSDSAITSNQYADPWGYHALRWKAASQPAHAYTPPNLAPFLVVDGNDHTQLDNLEMNSSVFATQPAGSWLKNTTVSSLETAIGAALYMDFWKSPSYANLKLTSESIPRPAALMQVEFCVDAIGNNNSVVDYCAASAASVGIFTPRYPIDEIDRLCGLQYGGGFFFIRHVDIDHWGNGTNFTQSTRLAQPLFNSAVADAGTLHQFYVADPPQDGEAADAFVHEVSQRLSGRLTEPVPTRSFEITEDGSVEVQDEGHGLVAALPAISAER